MLLSSATIRASLLLTFIVCSARADDPAAPDPDLPQPFDASSTLQALVNSPFTRSVNIGETVRLTGIAYVEGQPMATFLNKETKESFTVSEEPNPKGWKLTEASPSTELRDSEVTLQVGPEEVTMHFGDEQLSPGGSKKGVPTTHIAAKSISSKSSSHSEMPSEGSTEHIKVSSLLGKDGKALYSSLSSTARSKFKDIVTAHIEKSPSLTEEQRSAYAQKIFNSIKAADQKSGGDVGVKSKKSSKPSRK